MAIARHHAAGLLYISYLTHPTTGGVTASFASLGDITLAEPRALIGFTGPRVIEQTIKQKLPEGFQLAEFQEEHGFVDQIVHRKDMRSTLALLLKLHSKEGDTGMTALQEAEAKVRELDAEIEKLSRLNGSNLDTQNIVRSWKRPNRKYWPVHMKI